MNAKNTPTPRLSARRKPEIGPQPERVSGVTLQERIAGICMPDVPAHLQGAGSAEGVLAERQRCACREPVPCALFVP